MSLESALEMHRNGQLDGAEAAYREILAAEEVADAAYLLGVLRHQRGDDDEAETLLRRAIARDDESARYHLALGGVQMHRGEESTDDASLEAHAGTISARQIVMVRGCIALMPCQTR